MGSHLALVASRPLRSPPSVRLISSLLSSKGALLSLGILKSLLWRKAEWHLSSLSLSSDFLPDSSLIKWFPLDCNGFQRSLLQRGTSCSPAFHLLLCLLPLPICLPGAPFTSHSSSALLRPPSLQWPSFFLPRLLVMAVNNVSWFWFFVCLFVIKYTYHKSYHLNHF